MLISVGAASSFLFVNVSNKCGTRQSNKLYITSPQPDQPLLQVTDSDIDGYPLISISNASGFTAYQWHLDSVILENDMARTSSYVAYLPGLYRVDVSNAEGCWYLPEASEGLEIMQENQVFSIYTGAEGYIVVENHSSAPATLNIYDFMGRIQLIETVDPGTNEIFFGKRGAFIVAVGGSGTSNIVRIFSH